VRVDPLKMKVSSDIKDNIRKVAIIRKEIGNKNNIMMDIDQKWEQLMWKYQQVIPGGKPGEKWQLMDKIFDLKEAIHQNSL
jgi:hypothetical protein